MFKPSQSRKRKASKGKAAIAAQTRLHLRPLEQRVLLDAAAVQTAQEVAAQGGAGMPPDDVTESGDADLIAALETSTDAAQAGAEQAANAIYFVDRSVPEVQTLVDALPSGAEVHYIEAGVDGVEFIAATLQGRSEVAAIHVLSHGEAGQLQLGSAELTAASMQGAYRDELLAIGQALTADADILVYGCDFGQGDVGGQAAELLSSLTGADVASSIDLTGAAELGGDWHLEREVGTVETRAVAADAWDHLLLAPTMSTTSFTIVSTTEDLGGTAAVTDPNVPPPARPGIAVSTFAVTTTDGDTSAAAPGIAIVGADNTHGQWWYSLNSGTTWAQLTNISDAHAMLLSRNVTTTRVFFQPHGDFNGTSTLTIRAWDKTSGADGQFVNITATGGTTAFSSTTAVGTLTLSAVADIMADTINGANAAVEDTAKVFNPIAGTGGATADAFEGSNPQITAIAGQAIVPGGTVAVTNGTVSLGADGQTLTFRGAADWSGTTTFSYTVTSGSVTETANIAMTVTAVADAPRIDLDTATAGADYAANYDQGAVAIGNLVSVTDPDGDNLASMTVTLTGATAADSLTLMGTVTGITASYNSATGVLTLSGNATPANYQTALGLVRFATTSGATTARTISVAATSSAVPIASNVAVATITPVDSDGDGVANAGDIDDDNDGLLDTREAGVSLIADGGFTASTFDSGWTANSENVFTASSQGIPNSTLTGGLFDELNPGGNADTGARGLYVNFDFADYYYSYAIPQNLSAGTYDFAFDLAKVPAFSDSSGTDFYRIVLYSGSATSPTTSIVLAAGTIQSLTTAFQNFSGSVTVASPGSYSILVQVNPNGAGNGDFVVDRLAFGRSGDKDQDSVPDRLDLDSDNDGITDNVEAQATAGYLAPSGQGSAVVDADDDGLDDRYDANTANASSAASLGLTPVDTDGDALADYLDADSDNDGKLDLTERGDGQPTSMTSTADTDRDGLLDIFEHGSVNDGFYVHDGSVTTSGSGLATTVVSINLADSDEDTAASGSDASPPARDFDWRDNVMTPAIDLNSAVGAADGSRDNTVSQTSGGAAVNLAMANADVSDFGDNDLASLRISLGGVQDGANEVLNIAGIDFALNADRSQAATVDGVDFLISYTVAGGFVITRNGGGAIAQAALDTLVRGMAYRHTLASATAGARTLSFVVTDAGGASSSAAVATVQVVPGNVAPVNTVPGARTVDEDSALAFTGANAISVNDADGNLASTHLTVGNGTLTVNLVGGATISGGANGTGTLTLSGTQAQINAALASLVYQGNANFNGADTLTVLSRDSAGVPLSDTDTVAITVNPVNDAPAAVDDTASTNEDTPLSSTVNLQANDSDLDGDLLSVVAGTFATSQGGSITIAADGSYTYTPPANFSGIDTVDYTVTDGSLTDVGRLTITVTAVNDTPVPLEPVPPTPGQTFNPATGNYAAETQEDTDFSGRVAATDADGDTLSYAVTTQPTHGTVTIDAATGAYTYTPTPDFNGSDSFVVTIADGNGGTAQTTVTMTVAAVADIAADTVTTVEDTLVNIAVLGNDMFENGGRSVTAINGAAVTVGTPIAVSNGTVTLRANGTLDFQPTANFNGATSFSYTVTSGGVTETASVTVNATASNDTPANTLPGAQSTSEDTAKAIVGVSVADIDSASLTSTVSVTGGTLSVTTGGGATITGNGSASVTLSGTAAEINAALAGLSYTPTADYNGTATLTLVTSDGSLNDTDTVAITVAAVADIAPDTVTTAEDMPINVAVLGNDSFENGGRSVTTVNGAAVTVDTPVAVSNGTVTLRANGTLDFQPAANFNGATSFSYTVSSGGVTETASVTVNVTASNDTPVPLEPIPPTPGQTFNPATGNYAAETQEDTDFSGRVAATDADGDTLSYAVTTQPTHGTVTIDAATGAYTYTPTPDFNGSDSFVVTIADGNGGTAQTTVTMTVAAVADIAPDTVTTVEDTRVNIAVLGNDSFENSGRTIAMINGTAVTVGTPIAVSNGTVTLQSNGTLDFQPAANFNGATSFSYTVSSGGVTETASVTVNVTANNDTPVPLGPIPPTPGQTFDPATRNYAAETQEDTDFSGRVAATDADGDTLSYAVTTQPSHGTVTIDAATGAYTYTPTADFNGFDSFVVTISDGNGGTAQTTVTMTVAAVADIAADTVTTTEDMPINIAVLGNDTFENGGRSVTAINGAAVTVDTPVAVSNGMVTLLSNGTLDFQPTANFNGAASFSYTVTSGGVTETASVTVNVTANNDTPVPLEPIPPTPGQTFNPATGNYAAQTQEDTAFSGRVAATDADGDTLSYAVTTQPSHGTVTIDAATGAYTYTPTADFNGVDSFVVTVSDGHGGTVPATVTMTVAAATDIAPDTVTTTEDTLVNIAVLGNDMFENSGRSVTAINGTAVTVGTPIAVSNGMVTLKTDGTLDFTPTANFNGATSFSYTVSSGGVTETASVAVTVTGDNYTPVPLEPIPPTPGQTFDPSTRNYAAETLEDTAFNGRVAATDADGDTLSYAVTTRPSNGTVTIDAATGAYTYTPTADFNGSDSFVVTIADGKGGTAQTTVTMTVAAVADATIDSISTTEDRAVTVNVLTGTNGASADNFEDGARAVTAVTQGAHGSVSFNADGTVVYTPNANYNGPDSFSYTVTSGGVTETATVTVNVTTDNDTPVPSEPIPPTPGQTFDPATGNYAAETQEDVAFSGRVAATDADGDTLSYTVSTQPARGTVTIDAATGAYTYTPAADYHGADSFVVAISDGHGGMVQSTVSLTVTPVADIAPDTVTTVEDTRVNIAINANDTFENAGHAVSAINGTAVTVGVPIAVSNGMVTLQADGTLDFQPAANFNGATSFSYTVTSGGTSETATVNVTVTAQNDVPVPIDPGNPQYPAQNFDPDSGDYSLVTPEDTPVSGQVVATDADGDTLIYVVVTPPAHGTLAFDSATGEYSYTPNQDFNGKDSFVVAIDDGKGGTTETTVNIEVTPVNDPPLPADPQSPSQNFDPATGDYSLVTPEDVPVDGKIVAIDPDGDPLTYTAGIPPANGTMVVHPDGTYTYTPARDFNGEDSFTVVIDDGKGGTTTTTVNVTVTPVQDVPVVVDPKVPGQNFDPITDTSTLTTPQDTPIDGRVVVEDPDGDMLTYETVTPPAHGTVVVKPDGSFTYTPNPGFNGDDSFVVMVDDGHGNRVPAVVDVKVVPTAARDDYPFVFLPEGGNGEAGERSNGAAHTEVEPAVLGDAVDRIDSLASVPALRAGGAVLQAVNGVRSLDGTASLDVGGAVLTAVNGVDSLKSIDAPAEQRDDLQRTLGGSAGDGAVQPTMISSLHLEGGGLALNLVAGGPQVWIDVTGRGDVRAIQAFGPEGSALPDWVRVDSRGHISIDRPADVERLRMRLEVQRERGAGSSHLIEIDFNSGQMRVLKDAGEGAAKPARGQSSGTRAAPDFATQLARAADRRDPMDAALLELLS